MSKKTLLASLLVSGWDVAGFESYRGFPEAGRTVGGIFVGGDDADC